MCTDSQTRAFYESHSLEYFSLTYDADVQKLRAILTAKLLSGSIILDIGCGSGRDVNAFNSLGFKSFGFDLSFSLLRLGKRYFGDALVQGSLAHLPFACDSFDGVWAIGSYLHVPRHSIMLGLLEARRVLKPKARIMTSMKKGEGYVRDTSGRLNELYMPQEWASRLENVGFHVESMKEMTEHRKQTNSKEVYITAVQWFTTLAIRV
jgi:SAM-dependent methyltransferase